MTKRIPRWIDPVNGPWTQVHIDTFLLDRGIKAPASLGFLAPDTADERYAQPPLT